MALIEIDGLPIKTSIYEGLSMAMLNNQRVYPPWYFDCQTLSNHFNAYFELTLDQVLKRSPGPNQTEKPAQNTQNQ